MQMHADFAPMIEGLASPNHVREEDRAERFWNKLAARYSKQPIANLPAYHAKLEATKARLNPDDVILDIGCGTGSLALELAPCVSRVHAIDISREMVKIANRKAVAQGITNATFHNTTVGELSAVERETFDSICAFNILHLVDDYAGVLAKIFEMLKPGGSFISTTPCLAESLVPFWMILPLMKLVGKAPEVWLLKVAALERNLQAAGFTDIERPEIPAGKATAFFVARKPLA